LKVNKKRIFKTFLWIIGSIIGLIFLLLLLIQIPFVQNFAKDKAVVFLQDKIKTKVEIGTIDIAFPKKIILNDVYFEDQSNDTLLAGKTLKIDISLFQLLNNKVEINSIDLNEITANISVNKDSVFNFDYIIKAFETPNEPKTDEKGMEISIKKINLNKIKFKYKDAVAKNNVDLYINHFDTDIKKFDLNNLNFDVPDINLNGLKLTLNQDLVEATKKVAKKIEEEAETTILKLNLKDINLENIDLTYKDAITNLDTKIEFENLKTEVKTIDLEKQIIAIKSIEINKTKGQLTLTKSEPIAPTPTESSSSLGWKIDVEDISITEFNFAFDNNNEVKTQKGIDFNHLKIEALNFKGNSIAINDDAYNGEIETLSFTESSGFQLEELKTEFNYTSKGAFLKNLYAKTPQTILQDNIIVTYPSIKSLTENPENLTVNANLKNSKLGFKDVLLLVPNLNLEFNITTTKPTSLNLTFPLTFGLVAFPVTSNFPFKYPSLSLKLSNVNGCRDFI